ncbi:hypothetical protein BDW02DRAFT_425098 [Decorospora gaudefroyi]|uniref:Vacuolar protein sorting-associated protein 62 n=1 Tax=Decorospora gaudefroyi TaxID=184978 RepID=A0A6A5KBC1_9PLEO|nr:hypothetical protein BDW02DRAFT_425098 [Decorospora gaudefroyi]
MSATKTQNQHQTVPAPPKVPQYVLDHAPLLHLYTKDPYRPSSLATHLHHTHPEINFKPVPVRAPGLTLDTLNVLNEASKTGVVYLTSNEDVSTDPEWLKGVGAGGKTGVVVVVPRGDAVGDGDGVVDVYYFYFFSFNFGGVVLGKELGDHVGDWEHSMIRFVKGVPKYVWLSQHANGEAYTYKCLNKDVKTGKRPILYCANGSHAIYPTAGPHDHTIPNFNLPTPILLVDDTDAGPLYDSLLDSYYYEYSGPSSVAPSGTFTPYYKSRDDPVGFLYFTGRWGDEEYPADDPRQKGKGLFTFKKYVGGPTGPVDKQLLRKEVWPQNQWSGGQRIRTRLPGVARWWEELGKWLGGKFGMKKSAYPNGTIKMTVDGKRLGVMQAGKWITAE